MRITELKLNSIGPFEELDLKFDKKLVKNKSEIHILTGINGSGKSTILKSIVSAFESIGTTPDNDLVCTKDTNELSNYFRNKISKNIVRFEDDNEFHVIESIKCPKGQNHLHIVSKDNEGLRNYRNALISKSKPESTFDSALFAYSGNRKLVDDSSDNFIANNNPLFESLEFNKKPNKEYTIDNWIKTSLFKRSYAKDIKLNSKVKQYEDTIERIEKAVSEIINQKVQFKLENFNLSDVLIKIDNTEHSLKVLPDGLKSIFSWLSDLCMRLENLNWNSDTSIFDRNIILFLDEIEVHLHIDWQRRILPVIQKLCPNAQIFVSTHSPFVVNSIDGAYVYSFVIKNGFSVLKSKEITDDSKSISYILHTIFNVYSDFGIENDKKLQEFYSIRDEYFRSKDKELKLRLEKLANALSKEGSELETIVSFDLKQIEKYSKA